MNDSSAFGAGIRLLLSCGVVPLAVQSTTLLAQTLNDATTAQLAADNDSPPNPCALLLDGDPLTVLGNGALAEICDRFVDQAGPATSSSGGGGAATPPSPPAAVEARLKKEGVEEDGASVRGFFFTIGEDSIDRTVSTFEDGYQSDVLKVAAGFDRTVGGSWIAGFAVDFAEQEGDFIDGFDFEIRSIGVTGYGSRLIGENASLDFYFGYAQLSNERQRRATFEEISGDDVFPTVFSITGAPTADFDADQVLTGIRFSRDWVRDNLTFGPRLGLDWNRTGYDTYDEVDDSGLALTFHDDKETSSQFFAGVAGSIALSTSFGVVVIHESLAYRYETDQDQRNVEVSFVEDTRSRRFTYQTEKPDRGFLEFTIGATFILRNGLQVLTEYGGITSHKYLDTHSFVVGFRKEL
jgi:uncharacterized protein YhjY with autotransporter beta-barrel domain